MLVVSRKKGEKILIGDDIVIVISKVKGETVRVGIEAPLDIRILREECKDQPPPPEKVAA